MNVATIQVPKAEAESKLREYRKRIHAKADSEYARIRDAYEAAAAGKPLLFLSQVYATCPRDILNRPMLAIARADRRQVQVRVQQNSDVFSTEFHWSARRHSDSTTTVVRSTPLPSDKRGEGYSLVPITPPDVARGHNLAKRFVLWEVQQWSDVIIRAVPDKDPYLLERIGDDLFVVVGEWDLTPLEQAIMRDRARN